MNSEHVNAEPLQSGDFANALNPVPFNEHSSNRVMAQELLKSNQSLESPRKPPEPETMDPSESLEFESIMSKLNNLPLWVKQALYLQFGKELEKAFSLLNFNDQLEEDILQFHAPHLTVNGGMLLKNNEAKESEALMTFLKHAQQGKNIMNICASCQWSLAQTCILMVEAIDKKYVLPPNSPKSNGSMSYLAGKTRLGEYLVQIGRITLEQLDEALRAQHYILEVLGEQTKLADILINLGYIKKRECESILFLKEESKKVFYRNAFSLTSNS